MKQVRAGVVLLMIQLVLVLSVAGKYLYERKTRPRVWTRATQVDPEHPLRGRYLALQLLVDACQLPRDAAHFTQGFIDYNKKTTPGSWNWEVSLGVESGQLMPRLEEHPKHPQDVHRVTQREDQACARARLQADEEFFIPEHAVWPRTLPAGQELWVEVTVPAAGPPRPIQIALSDGASFRPVGFR